MAPLPCKAYAGKSPLGAGCLNGAPQGTLSRVTNMAFTPYTASQLVRAHVLTGERTPAGGPIHWGVRGVWEKALRLWSLIGFCPILFKFK